MSEVTNRTSGGGPIIAMHLIFALPGSIEEGTLLSLADGSMMSSCPLPCTTHQIYAWLTHISGRPPPLTGGDRVEEGLMKDRAGESRGFPKKGGQEQEITLIFSQQVEQICL